MVRGSVPSKRQTHQFLLLHGYIAKVSQILKAALPNRKYYSMLSWDENTQCFGGLILVPSAKMTIFFFFLKCSTTIPLHKYFSLGTVSFPIALH